MSRLSESWWNCPLCEFKMRDDGSMGDAQRMGDHITEHELEQEAAFQNWLAAGMPGTQAELRVAFHAILVTRALKAHEVVEP